jgi:glycosyltransferase involved in cell wall biosynthesis
MTLSRPYSHTVTRMRVTVLSPSFPPMPGGLADYTGAWCEAVALDPEISVWLVTSSAGRPSNALSGITTVDDWSWAGRQRLRDAILQSDPDVIVVQYVPHAYTARGGGLPFAFLLRRILRRIDIPIVINAHELYGRFDFNLTRLPWLVAQRCGVSLLISLSTRFIVTVGSRHSSLTRWFPRQRDKICYIPIGPTIQPLEPDPYWRKRNGVPLHSVLLLTFGLGHPSQKTAVLHELLDHCVQEQLNVRLVVFGQVQFDHPLSVPLGYLSADEAALALAAADLCVFDLAEGVSSRRSALISSLASGVAVLGTHGPETDLACFPSGAIRLTPAGDSGKFVRAAVELIRDPDARNALAAGATALTNQRFSWEVIARQWTVEIARTVAGKAK